MFEYYDEFLIILNRVFPKLYKVGNVANKGLHREKQNKFNQKLAFSGDWNQDLLIIMPMLYSLS